MKQLFVVYLLTKGDYTHFRTDLFLTYDKELAEHYVIKAKDLLLKAREIYTDLHCKNEWEDDTIMDKYHYVWDIEKICYEPYTPPKQLEIR